MGRNRYFKMAELQSNSYFLAIYLLSYLPLSDAIFQWTAPPPAWNQTNPGTADIHTAVIRVLNGRKNYNLRWNYTLPAGESITFTFFEIGNGISQPDTIGYILNGLSSINDRHEYQTRFRIESTREFSALTINTVTEQEEATFQCKLQVGSNTWAYNIRVEVTVAPDITHISGNQNVFETDVVNLNCTADGNPTPNITWTKIYDNSVVTFPLTITGTQNEGIYRCTADNSVGDPAIADVFIAVQIPPNITDISGNQTVIQNDNVALNCTAFDKPAPNITWTRLSDNAVVNSTIHISGKQDEGGYRCTADNGVGESATAEVFIAVQIPPNIIYISGNQTVNQNENVTLNCTADGYPAPNITWTKISGNSVVTFPLTIIGKQDEGVYRCSTDNGVGDQVTADVFIDVQNYRPENTNLTTNATVVVNTNFNLICSAQADPPAKYRFYKEHESLLNTTTGSNIAVYTISVSEKVNQIDYRCTPFNDHGDGPTKMIGVTVHYPPEIVSFSSSQQVVEGDEVILFCNATGNPPPSIAWTKQGSKSLLSTSKTLHLTSLTRGDDGVIYKCKVKNNIGSEEATATISVLYEPSVTIQQCSTPVTEGKNATLQCTATGNPAPNITWIRASTGEVVSYNKMISITAISRRESGSYDCLAWNAIGNNSKTCTMDVHYPPSASTLSSVPSNTTVLRGSPVSLICSTDANPNARAYVFWFSGDYIGFSNSGVLNVTIETDGVYTCFPINGIGTGQATVSFTVVVPSSAEINETTGTLVEGSGITFFCNASGKPEPTVIWTRVGSSEVLSNTSSLTVMNVSRPGTPDNMIQYQCTASNGVESPATATANVTVQYPPEIAKPETSIRKVRIGESTTVECLATGNPSPGFVWTNATDGVVATDRYLILNSVDDSDGGNYTCTGTNDLDSASFTILVKVTRTDIALEWPVEKLNGEQAVYQPKYDDLNSAPAKAFVEKFVKEVDQAFANDSAYEKAEVTGLRKGTVIVSFVLYFTTPVTTNEGLAKLHNAVVNATFGPFSVGTLKIEAVSTNRPYFPPSSTADTPRKRATSPSSTSRNSSSTSVKEEANVTSASTNSSSTPVKEEANVTSGGGGVLVVAIIVGLLNMLDPS